MHFLSQDKVIPDVSNYLVVLWMRWVFFLNRNFFVYRQQIYSLVTSDSFGSTSIRICRDTGCRANLFLARHSYDPESFFNADLIISSDLFLKYKKKIWKHRKFRSKNYTTLTDSVNSIFSVSYLKCNKFYIAIETTFQTRTWRQIWILIENREHQK